MLLQLDATLSYDIVFGIGVEEYFERKVSSVPQGLCLRTHPLLLYSLISFAMAGGEALASGPGSSCALRDADLEFMHEEIKLAALRGSGTFINRNAYHPQTLSFGLSDSNPWCMQPVKS